MEQSIVSTHSLYYSGKLMKFEQTFGYYRSSCSNDSRASGAYVFRPDGPKVGIVLNNEKSIETDEFWEVQQAYSDNVAQNARVYKKGNYVEFDWIVGPINVSEISDRSIPGLGCKVYVIY